MRRLATGVVPRQVVGSGTATPIATGAMLPRGADAVVMVEHALAAGDGQLLVQRPVAPGGNVTFAGTDMARGELVLREGTRLSSRETGVLAAIGMGAVRGRAAAASGRDLDGRRDHRAGRASAAGDGLRRERDLPGRRRPRAWR